MKNCKAFAISLCLLLCVTIPPIARADQWNEATKVTFSAATEVPERVLPAGTYWLTLPKDDPDRNIVQVWNVDRTQLLATIMTIPDSRLKPTGKTVITFEERSSDQPEAIQAWFYPGDDYGHEFVYPESRAKELAKRANQPVLSMPDELTPNITQPAKSGTEPPVVALKNAPVKAVKPTGEEISITEIVIAPTTGRPHQRRAALV